MTTNRNDRYDTRTPDQNKPATTGLKKGDRVRTINRTTETVLLANDSQVITYESQAKGSWYHPTKVTRITISIPE